MIMWVAPIGAFGAIAAVVGGAGWAALVARWLGHAGLLRHLPLFVLVVLGAMLRLVTGLNLKLLRYLGPGVPADRGDLVVGVGAAAPDRQDGARGRRSRPVVGITVPTGYSFNLDGTAIYLTMASLFVADAMGKPLAIGRADRGCWSS